MPSLNSLMSGGYDPFEIDAVAVCEKYDSEDNGGEWDDEIEWDEYSPVQPIDQDELPF